MSGVVYTQPEEDILRLQQREKHYRLTQIEWRNVEAFCPERLEIPSWWRKLPLYVCLVKTHGENFNHGKIIPEKFPLNGAYIDLCIDEEFEQFKRSGRTFNQWFYDTTLQNKCASAGEVQKAFDDYSVRKRKPVKLAASPRLPKKCIMTSKRSSEHIRQSSATIAK